MIDYSPGKWGVCFIFKCHGSVFPKASLISVANVLLAIGLFHLWRHSDEDLLDGEMKREFDGFLTMWSGYTSVLGFLVVFRNNQAYSRLWEGAGLLNQVRGEWFNAASNLISFCTKKEDKMEEVQHFQEIMVRLMSMLHCHALGQICDFSNGESLEIISHEGFDEKSLIFLATADNTVEVVLQWVQQLIVDAQNNGVITIAPPILSRAFQELSRGIVSLNNARKIKDVPFPFPYAQLVTCMLLVHWGITAFVASILIQEWYWGAIICFFSTFALWCLTYIALEMDQPFGEDANDLPFREKQQEFNRGLLTLLEPSAQHAPTLERKREGCGGSRIKLASTLVYRPAAATVSDRKKIYLGKSKNISAPRVFGMLKKALSRSTDRFDRFSVVPRFMSQISRPSRAADLAEANAADADADADAASADVSSEHVLGHLALLKDPNARGSLQSRQSEISAAIGVHSQESVLDGKDAEEFSRRVRLQQLSAARLTKTSQAPTGSSDNSRISFAVATSSEGLYFHDSSTIAGEFAESSCNEFELQLQSTAETLPRGSACSSDYEMVSAESPSNRASRGVKAPRAISAQSHGRSSSLIGLTSM